MATENAQTESDEASTFTLSSVVAWVMGILTVFVGYDQFFNDYALFSILLIPLGVFVLPPVRSRIEDAIGIHLSRYLVVAIFLVVYVSTQLLYNALMSTTGG